jgi:hypothetical protein
VSFTPEELQLLKLSDAVEDVPTASERNMLHCAESRARRIQRIGLAEYRRIVREQYLLRQARRARHDRQPQEPA